MASIDWSAPSFVLHVCSCCCFIESRDDEPPPPDEWWLLFDSNSKRFYYYNPNENRTAWHLPEAPGLQVATGAAAAACPVIPLACKLVTILNSLKTANVNIDYGRLLDTALLAEIRDNLKLEAAGKTRAAAAAKYPAYLNFLLRNQVYGQYVLDLVGDIVFSNSLQVAAKLTDCLQADEPTATAAPVAESTLSRNKRRLQPRTNPNYINVDLVNRNDGSLIKNTYVKLQDLPPVSAANTLEKKSTAAAEPADSPQNSTSSMSHSNSSSKLNNSLSKAALLLLNILSDKNYNSGGGGAELKVSASSTSVNTICGNHHRLTNGSPPDTSNLNKENILLSSSVTLVSENGCAANRAKSKASGSVSVKPPSANGGSKPKNFSSLSTSLTRRNTESNVKYITSELSVRPSVHLPSLYP